ncbi:chromosome partitioning protein ParA [Photobacterium sp. DA100]|uniref:chromosome partitioning protein ParA n=1 Tax=Photobacterium sp. DA100 TaxID=3027472 RepID=UPI00247906D7|nr:chromosome partitioning protein ParA [Photobacterium sp. DA100]WEM42344.1 chromosome partitioning protein ParA [Photobacterium sp. DA100]
MHFKYSAIAASMIAALSLTGCGSDSSSSTGGNTGGGNGTELAQKPTIAVPATGQFIDAKVEGLHFVSGEKAGITDADGNYDVDSSAPGVNFYLGGEDGMLIGSVSSRHVTTPFEAVGTHQRAVNLARLLLTLDTTAENSTIVLPEAITSPSYVVKSALKTIQLDDVASFTPLLEELGKTEADLVTEENAINHMNASLKDIARGSDVVLTHWAKGSNWTFISRRANQRIRRSASDSFQNVIHADRSLGDELFEQTGGLTASIYTLAKDNFVMRKGSNDGSISDYFALQYLSCVDEGGKFDWDDNTDQPTCNGDSNISIAPALSGMAGNSHYQYVLADPTATSTADEHYDWAELTEMGGAYACMASGNCSEQSLTKFEIIERDDADEGEAAMMLREVISGSYDPITDVYVQTRSKEYLDGNHAGRISESINFLYPVEAVGQDRYVDFKGTWLATESRENCDLVAESTLVFDETGVTLTGQEFNGNCSLSAELNETASYAELATMDFWWFGTNQAGVSKATLDQLNTTIRWNDVDEDEVGPNYKINRFSYIPAGKNWDRGTLVRDTLSDNGVKSSTITMRKQ